MARHRTSRWLGGAVANGGLLIPGFPSRRSCDLRLTADAASASADDLSVIFAWEDFAGERAGRLADSWSISEWSSGRSGPIGVGLAVDGRYVEATMEIRRRRRSLMNRVNRSLQDGVVLPLCAIGHISDVLDDDRTMISVLCTVLAEREELRPRMNDSNRLHRLVADLMSRPHDPIPLHVGVRRRTLEILTALRALGYEHRLGGRPLPDETITSVDDLALQVLAKVRANPYAQGLNIDETTVREVVYRYYVAVAPWPIAALMD